MPRFNVEPIRRRQLIEATLRVIEDHGFQGTTIGRISAASGLSVGIVSHYFGGKQGLLEATMRHLLTELRNDMRRFMADYPRTPEGRLQAIVDANFSGVQTQSKSARTWLIFWSQAAHSPDLARLQRVNERRLYSNLVHSLRPLLPAHAVSGTAHTIAAMIDGFWLRTALSEGRIGHTQAVELCKAYIDQAIHAGAEHAPTDTYPAQSGATR